MNPSIAYLQVPWGSGGRVELVRSTIGSRGNPHTSLDIVTAPGRHQSDRKFISYQVPTLRIVLFVFRQAKRQALSQP